MRSLQLVAITKLQRVWDDLHATGEAGEAASSGLTLMDAVDGGSSWSLWRAISSKLEAPAPPPTVRGLYLYGASSLRGLSAAPLRALTLARGDAGGVGTGKTMLMDVFYDSLPPGVRRKRIHFLDFMLDVHRRLRSLTNVADPLAAVAQARSGGGVPQRRAR